ncbi:MAG: hypothetical protein A2508_01020 [Candidatus Lambdaproteobacteria bacterium RIFOXYD12_FULL_49_8]|uniref:DUF3108 domain-containing protein n=1 Tax=Candidatus Lambdaproteobacteria bacterium RIFOXYD2_FULL_50_16 TaxID=1817772 RepID=A0A1F6GBN7_9PROT|nr:MAG: hypothetical protein A2527_06670 [Candidatus Lambdaproteobacteria bacterium RIFOXYD2_FULL_50_16]OGG97543.1 MAG: hypothetical protein A2508_01020 [Candidatus Lambdaproteobacteria bacterium RIFOXYD12_FULL_49_8]
MRKNLLLGLVCCLLGTTNSLAEGYPGQIRGGLELRYEHRNRQSQQITGYSELTYHQDDRGRLIERLKNRKPDGEVFQEKESLFSAGAVQLLEYRETDYRRDWHILDRFNGGKISSQISLGGQKMEFIQAQEVGMVIFEELTLYLQKHLNELTREPLRFTLYLPQLAFDLKKNNLPQSMARLAVEARVEKQFKEQTPLGEAELIEILVKPTNPLLLALMPAEKISFHFTYFSKAPQYLYRFSEAQTESSLAQVKLP